PHQRRGATVGLSAVAERLQRVLLLGRLLAGLPPHRSAARDSRLPAAPPPFRRLNSPAARTRAHSRRGRSGCCVARACVTIAPRQRIAPPQAPHVFKCQSSPCLTAVSAATSAPSASPKSQPASVRV